MVLILLLAAPSAVYAADADSKAGAVTTSGTRLNVRKSPSTGAPVAATLNKGSYITLLSRTGDWWRVEYGKGLYGYCHKDYITIVQGTPTTVKTQAGSLNVRGGPGTSYPKTASLSKGETVILLTTSGGWSRVLYHGTKTGYVSAQYLASGYAPVSLSVPSFKQTDSRWANMQVALSGKTFAQIGCATTAVAMMESYRTGKTIYPHEMMRSLNYTASGDLYWPSHYIPVTETANYLPRLYELLRQEKPVLLGARNAYGRQHWVVITGFAGGSTLSAASFTIQDPGTYSRTNLQQFLNAYPTVYKYFYYGG